jgi:PTS system ascorbate-specific IIB component
MKIITACGLGTGTALFLKMTVDSILKKEGIDATVETADSTLAPTIDADIIVTARDLKARFAGRARAREIIAIDNYGNREEIRQKLLEAIGRLNDA